MTDSLVTWFSAQLDDDERFALAHLDLRRSQGTGRETWAYKLVVADVEAKRRILDEHQTVPGGTCRVCTVWDEDDDWQARGYLSPCPTVRLLALPYADREGYQEEWRP